MLAALGGCSGASDTAPVRFTEFSDPESQFCIEMRPVVDTLQAEYEPKLDRFEVVDVTTAEGSKRAQAAGIFVTPTFLLADVDGNEIDRIIGATTEDELRAAIDEAIKAAR